MGALDVRCESSDSRLPDDPTIRKIFFSLAGARLAAGGRMR